MPLFINANIAALNAQRNRNGSPRKLGTTFARLVSGMRINAAKVDVAGISSFTRVGAVQDPFLAVINNLGNRVENVSAARFRMVDADIAVETGMLIRNAILQQAGTGFGPG